MRDGLPEGHNRFVDGLAPGDRERALAVLLGCATVELASGPAILRAPFPPDVLLLVARGFVVLRATTRPDRRSVVTCEAGAGHVLLPPRPGETLTALEDSQLVVIDPDARRRLLGVPALAERVVERLAVALGEKQDATASFAPTRHVERVRRRLLHLARSYGHVGRDGIRIDFPVSHALLAEMIGSSRETVTRAVDELQRAGFVERRGSTYRLHVPPETVMPRPPA